MACARRRARHFVELPFSREIPSPGKDLALDDDWRAVHLGARYGPRHHFWPRQVISPQVSEGQIRDRGNTCHVRHVLTGTALGFNSAPEIPQALMEEVTDTLTVPKGGIHLDSEWITRTPAADTAMLRAGAVPGAVMISALVNRGELARDPKLGPAVAQVNTRAPQWAVAMDDRGSLCATAPLMPAMNRIRKRVDGR